MEKWTHFHFPPQYYEQIHSPCRLAATFQKWSVVLLSHFVGTFLNTLSPVRNNTGTYIMATNNGIHRLLPQRHATQAVQQQVSKKLKRASSTTPLQEKESKTSQISCSSCNAEWNNLKLPRQFHPNRDHQRLPASSWACGTWLCGGTRGESRTSR
jgi:hypothetical protein